MESPRLMVSKPDKLSLKIAVLSPEAEALAASFNKFGDNYVVLEQLEIDHLNDFDLFISYGYRNIISPEIVALAKNKIVNLHISYLPWNRGADPNFWSFHDDTPKGVTIHFIDAGIDTGPIIAQREVQFPKGQTLKTSYERLKKEIETLFDDTWPMIRKGNLNPKVQPDGGSFHSHKEFLDLWPQFPLGFETPVSDIVAFGACQRVSN